MIQTDEIASAIRFLTDRGYVVVKGPQWALPELPPPPHPIKSAEPLKPTPTTLSATPPGFLSVKQFCKRFAISRSTAYVHIAEGRLRVQKLGRATRISPDAAKEWLQTDGGMQRT